MRKYNPFLLFVLFFGCYKGQNNAVDSIVSSMDLRREFDVDYLTDTLTARYNSDSLKVRAIYFWITENIAYDAVKLRTAVRQEWVKLPDDMDEDQWMYKKVWTTVKKKKGICQDYAELFAYMCKEAKVKCEVVTGYASDQKIWVKLKSPNCRHAWNRVCINGTWYLMDLTWASGTLNHKTGKFKKSRNDFYYCTSGSMLAETHRPDNNNWK